MNVRNQTHTDPWHRPTGSISRRAAAFIIIFLSALAFLLRIWNYDSHLPAVLHSDYVQVDLTNNLLCKG
ncbi:MAG: hypothetical protein ACKVS6_03930 [Planctomycetota bacterium]